MSARNHSPEHAERLMLHAVRALPAAEAAAVEAQLAACPQCRAELERLRPVTEALVAWPTNVLRPPAPLWDRVAQRIAAETGEPPLPEPAERLPKAEWEQAAPGIFCKVLATDTVNDRVSLLVRLEPNTAYPPHRHAGIEELHLLDGELWIEDRKLYPGDFNRGEPGTEDHRVFSETGCTCVLITSYRDVIL